ncbi:DUF5819 family protein [Virgibacillus kimchii]
MKKGTNITLIFILLTYTLFHFSMVFLHAAPINPVKTSNLSTIERYIYPFFSQNWQLFAPDPVNVNTNILVQYKTQDGEVSDWHNISKMLINANRKNPISAYSKASRIPTGIYHGVFSENELISEYSDTVDNTEFKENVDTEKIEDRKKKQVDILYRFVSSSIPLISDAEIKEVNTRIVNINPVPFSERFNKNYEVESEYVEFGWRSYTQVTSF